MQHFAAFLWLRWRIRVNQMKRGGLGNAIVLAILAIVGVLSALSLAFGGFLVGLLALPDVSPTIVMYVWDGVLFGFLSFWSIGLLADLQRTDSLALEKFLHLPVSLRSAFLINYLSSLICLTMIAFVPTMLGLALGLSFGRGPWMLLLFPLVAAFFLAVTAVTYQFQGWLAALFTNPRRRRSIVAFITIGIILVFQLPNLLNIARPWGSSNAEHAKQRLEKTVELGNQLTEKKITPDEYQKQFDQMTRDDATQQARESERSKQEISEIAEYANLALPPGWLALGARGLADGNPVPMLLGTLGFSLIGVGSLWRAYRTTLRLYTGQFTAGTVPADNVPIAVPTPAGEKREPRWPRGMEYQFRGIPEQAAAVACAAFRSLLRAPEAKMLLLSPIIFGVIFGGMLFANSPDVPRMYRPFVAFAGLAMTMFALQQFIGNQFSYDRDGFRIYILGPIPRHEILLGKNLAFAPIVGVFCAIAIVLVECLLPMRIDHFLMCFFQAGTIFLLLCLVANLLSIYAPMNIPAGTTRAKNVRFLPIILHMAAIMLAPVIYLPAILPLGLEILLAELDVVSGWPIALALEIIVFVGVVFLYRRLLRWEGNLLQSREQRILEVVASKGE